MLGSLAGSLQIEAAPPRRPGALQTCEPLAGPAPRRFPAPLLLLTQNVLPAHPRRMPGPPRSDIALVLDPALANWLRDGGMPGGQVMTTTQIHAELKARDEAAGHQVPYTPEDIWRCLKRKAMDPTTNPRLPALREVEVPADPACCLRRALGYGRVEGASDAADRCGCPAAPALLCTYMCLRSMQMQPALPACSPRCQHAAPPAPSPS